MKCCALDPSQKLLLIGSNEGQLNLLDISKPGKLESIAEASRGSPLRSDVQSIEFMPGENGVFQTLDNQKLTIWDAAQFIPAEKKNLAKYIPKMAKFRKNGKQIAIGHAEGVNFYDFKSGSARAEISDKSLSSVSSCEWSRKGEYKQTHNWNLKLTTSSLQNSNKSTSIAVGTSDGNLSIYDVRQSKKPFRKVQNRKRKLDQVPKASSVAAIKFGVCDGSLWALYRSPKKSVIIEVRVVLKRREFWSANVTENKIDVITPTKTTCKSAMISSVPLKSYGSAFGLPSPRILCYTDGSNILLRDLKSRLDFGELKSHYKTVNDIIFLPGRHELLSIGDEGIVLNWVPGGLEARSEAKTAAATLRNDNWSDSE